jgi:hypothetical protein
MNKTFKKNIITENIFICKYGALQYLPVHKPIKNYYNPNFFVNASTNFADIYVKSVHSLILAKEFIKNNMNPVVVTTVNKEFDCTNLENSANMYDDTINMKTNFSKVNLPSLYPLKGSEVIYSKYLSIIRDDTYNFNTENIHQVALITATPIHQPELLDSNMNLSDYFETKETIEAIFQTALAGNHDVLILGDFGCKFENSPMKDIVDIFNIMILKYGYYFKFIVISIPINDTADAARFVYFNKEIIKPQTFGIEVKEPIVPPEPEQQTFHTQKMEMPHNTLNPMFQNMFNNMINQNSQ